MSNSNTIAVSESNLKLANKLCPAERKDDFEAWFNEWTTTALEFLEYTRKCKDGYERSFKAA